ncbi:MAG: hypothetical protein IKN85_07080 [Oscillospiraceae bacterium]|nr:hypothetical protein [Oscillospiraceae bacterium]MBR3535574.1 hypothetical protein [Oscillospiraceae bacterium]MBR6835762.1 hypothetical protein [Oscillospiraceae bacterium]
MKTELKKIVFSKVYVISLVLLQIISFLLVKSNMEISNEKMMAIRSPDIWGNMIYPQSLYNSVLGFSENILLTEILCSIMVFGATFNSKLLIDDNKSDCYKGKGEYAFFKTKQLAVFVSGFLLAYITFTVNCLATALFIPAIEPEVMCLEFPIAYYGKMCSPIYAKYPLILLCLYYLVMSVMLGLISTMPFLLSQRFHNGIICNGIPLLFAVVIAWISYQKNHAVFGFLLPVNLTLRTFEVVTAVIVMLILINIIFDLLIRRRNR